MSWWTQSQCQQDRAVFQRQADRERPRMLGTKYGQRSVSEYQPTFDRAWGPVAPEHRVKQWKQDHGEAA